MAVFVAVALLVVVRLFNVSVVEGDEWRELGGKYVNWMPIEADRGNIYAEDGSLLAASEMIFDIRMDPTVVTDYSFERGIDSLSILITKYLNAKNTPSEWKAKLSKARSDWKKFQKPGTKSISIAKNLTFEQVDRARKFPIFRNGRYEGGLVVDKTARRGKPYKEMASRTIGVDRKNASKIGLEGAFDTFLKGKEEKRLMRSVGKGDWIPVFDPSEFETERGADLYTTIDIEVQDIVHNELLSMVLHQEAEAACAVVMDVETGGVKAISNLSRLKSGGYAEIYNHAVGTSSEPGSTAKLFTALALLEGSDIKLKDRVEVAGGRKKFYDLWMEDSHRHGRNMLNFLEVIEESSNVGIASFALKHFKGLEGKKKYVSYLEQFGLTDKTNIEIAGEPSPLIKHPVKNKAEWSGTTLPWMAHGYESSMTPLQILKFYNGVANDGQLMKPYLVKEISHEAEVLREIKPKVEVSSMASRSNIETLQFMLESVVESGTGKGLKSEIVKIAGKTGTARVNYTKKEERKKYNASFAGYFPADAPKYSMIVMFYDPKKGYYGGSVAGPVFKNIAEKIYQVKGDLLDPIQQQYAELQNKKMPNKHSGYASDYAKLINHIDLDVEVNSKSRWVDIAPQRNKLTIDKKKIKGDQVPDVIGMGLRDAVYILENVGLEVRVEGLGKVKRQSIKPGAKVTGQQIEIYLN